MMRQPPPRPAPNNHFAKLRNAIPAYLLATMIFLAACTPAPTIATPQPTAPPASTPTATAPPTAPPTAIASETPEPAPPTPETSAQSEQLRAEVLALVNPDDRNRDFYPTSVSLFLGRLINEKTTVVEFQKDLPGFAPGTSYVQIEQPNAQNQPERTGYYLFSGYYVDKDGVVKLGTHWVLSQKDLEAQSYQDMLELYAYLTQPITNFDEAKALSDQLTPGIFDGKEIPLRELLKTLSLGPLLTGEPPVQFEGPIPTVAQIRNLPRQKELGHSTSYMTRTWEHHYLQNPAREQFPEIQNWISILPSSGAEHPWTVGYSILSSTTPNNPPQLVLVLPDSFYNLQVGGFGHLGSNWGRENRLIFSPLVLRSDSTVGTSGIRHVQSISPIHPLSSEQPELPIRKILEAILLKHGFSPADVDRVITAGAFAVIYDR